MTKPSNILNRSLLTAFFILFSALIVSSGCVYYNTFYNAKKAFNEAEKSRKEASRYNRGRIKSGLYNTAIEKSLKVIENYPNSKYYDDALFVIAASYYYTKKYDLADRRFRELLANYPNSEFVKESEILLAKTKLELRENDEAMEWFERIFNSNYKKEFKAEAAFGLGQHYYDDKKYNEANLYFEAIRDSLGTDEEKKAAQRFIADGFFSLLRFEKALGAYLQILGMDPDLDEKYHSLYRAASCSYGLLKIDDGREYLNTLLDDEKYYDSTNAVLLKIAEGYELEDDLDAAVSFYQQVADDDSRANRRHAGFANYRLGLIHQFDYDELILAKEYYDEAKKTLGRGTDEGQDALERSADIGKLDQFARTLVIDSTTTQDMIDQAAYTQFQLSLLYWFNLNKPDSAILELQYLVDSFSTAYDAPKAMVALAQMYREHYNDSLAADSILNLALERYPTSDLKPEVLNALNLIGSPSDTGYAAFYIHKAEDFLVDDTLVDSAKYYYQYVVDNYQESNFYLQARFALLWIEEEYNPPGDSSLVFAYQEFIDSFPGNEWATLAQRKVKYRPRQVVSQEGDELAETTDSLIYDEEGNVIDSVKTADYVDPLEALYIDPNGNRAINLPLDPIKIDEPFVYPPEAYRESWEGELYFQVQIDFTGDVVDYILKIRSGIESIDQEATDAVASMTFDPSRLDDPELIDFWFVYKFTVRLPNELR